MKTIESIVSNFITTLTSAIEVNVRDNVMSNLHRGAKNGTSGGKLASGTKLPDVVKAARRKGPIQLCPVPGCKNRAAPVFGMVCSKHKDLPKSVIKKHREARKAKNKKPTKKTSKK